MPDTPRRIVCMLFAVCCLAVPASALEPDHQQQALDAAQRGLAFLANTQADDGSWSPQVGPAVTALSLRAFADAPAEIKTRHADTIQRAHRYLLDHAQPDGSIRSAPDGILANYNTAICVSALSRFDDAESKQAVQRGVAFLKGLQWQDGMTDAQGNPVTEDHAFYGGAGYGKHGRPDLSNTQVMLQALHDAGLPADDPAYQRALVFISRLQGSAANDFYPQGTIEPDGGAIYATSINQDLVGVPQSMANPEMIDAGRAGQPVSGLRGYGSMTYAAFKSFLYADLTPADQRVTDALHWIEHHYTLDRNPGMPADLDQQGLYYYYLLHARALSTFGRDTLNISHEGNRETAEVDWRANLINALVERQQPDGSWANPEPRWMENDPNLVTAYAVLALKEALR